MPGGASRFILRFDTSLLLPALASGVGVVALLALYAIWRERHTTAPATAQATAVT